MKRSATKKEASGLLKTGEALEEEVGRIYRLLGAVTQTRVLIESYEVDVLVKFSKGPIDISLIVECKEYAHPKRVSDIDMRSFVVKLMAARQLGEADRGVFVTTSSYSKTALATAKKHNIRCLTLEGLRNQLIDVQEYVQTTSAEFAESELAKWYLDQAGSDLEDYDSLPEAQQYLHTPLIKYVDQIFFKERERRLALLGNFGTGKTSFCLKYRDVLLRRYMSDPSQRIPVLISLRDYRSGIDIHQAITSLLQKLPGVQLDIKLCLELQRMGRFFFLLDGLDEMATKVDRTVINESLREIDRLNTEGDNLYLITCRTHFFQERIADEFLRDYRVVYITEWGRAELELYLKKRLGAGWQKYLKQILATPNLEELSKTPLLLDMIVKSLEKIKDNEEINSSKLYEAYTNKWVVDESKRRGAVMSAPQRRKFGETLATKLFNENRVELHFSELYEVAREFSGYGDATRLDYFDTDVRTCTFIVKNSKGNYYFRHKSFMEYFYAAALTGEINGGKEALLEAKQVPKEVMHFINRENVGDGGVTALKGWSLMFEREQLSQNALAILLRLGVTPDPEVEKHYGVSQSDWDSLQRAVTSTDAAAMEAFIANNLLSLRRMAAAELSRLNLRGVYDVDDVVQEVLLRLWSLADGADFLNMEKVNTTAYLRKVIRNLLVDRYRLSKRGEFVPFDTLDANLHPVVHQPHTQPRSWWDDVMAQDPWELFKRMTEGEVLTEEVKEMFIARFRDGESYEQIAERFDYSSMTVRYMMHRAKARVRHWARKELGARG